MCCNAYLPVSLTSVPGNAIEKIILGDTEKRLKDIAVKGHSQCGFMKAKSCLTNLIYFYDRVTHLTEHGETEDLDTSESYAVTKCTSLKRAVPDSVRGMG